MFAATRTVWCNIKELNRTCAEGDDAARCRFAFCRDFGKVCGKGCRAAIAEHGNINRCLCRGQGCRFYADAVCERARNGDGFAICQIYIAYDIIGVVACYDVARNRNAAAHGERAAAYIHAAAVYICLVARHCAAVLHGKCACVAEHIHAAAISLCDVICNRTAVFHREHTSRTIDIHTAAVAARGVACNCAAVLHGERAIIEIYAAAASSGISITGASIRHGVVRHGDAVGEGCIAPKVDASAVGFCGVVRNRRRAREGEAYPCAVGVTICINACATTCFVVGNLAVNQLYGNWVISTDTVKIQTAASVTISNILCEDAICNGEIDAMPSATACINFSIDAAAVIARVVV